MNGTMRRLRFGAFLAVATLCGVLVADVADAGPGVPTRLATTLNGQARVTDYQIIGSGAAPATLVFGRTLVCEPCSVHMTVLDSSLVVAGGGAVGLLPSDKEWVVAGFVGTLGITRTLDGRFVITMNGGAEAIREGSPPST